MPIMSAWVMPTGILGVLAMPFGLDAEFWRQMGYGIEWMDAVGLWIASLPGAFGRVTLFGTGPLLLATAGLLIVALLKTPLRLSGFALAALAALWAAFTPVPDVLVAADGRCAGPTAGWRFITAAAIRLRSANGWPPMPTAAMCTIAASAPG